MFVLLMQTGTILHAWTDVPEGVHYRQARILKAIIVVTLQTTPQPQSRNRHSQVIKDQCFQA